MVLFVVWKGNELIVVFLVNYGEGWILNLCEFDFYKFMLGFVYLY